MSHCTNNYYCLILYSNEFQIDVVFPFVFIGIKSSCYIPPCNLQNKERYSEMRCPVVFKEKGKNDEGFL